MATLVTAFITNVNQIDFRSVDTYIEYGNRILRLPIPKIMFLEQIVFDKYYKDTEYPSTTFLIFEKSDNYLFPFLSQLEHFQVHTNNVNKDTPEYMFIQCHKTEWLKTASIQNPYNTTDFIWVDFGLYHMIRNDETFSRAITALTSKTYPKVRIASCINPNQPCSDDLYKRVLWFFCGSVVGGNKEYLVQFADLMRDKCLSIIREKKHIMWEVNIWYLLYQEHKELFDFYMADHNISILENY
jgi:hypothetical protein